MPAILVLIIALFAASQAAAQSVSPGIVFGRYQQWNWQERDGLPQNSVLAIATTRDGYLWLGTYEGAARFDGVHFTLFNRSNTTGILNSLVGAVLSTRNGDLWLATFGGGLSRLTDGRFTAYTTREGLANDFTKCLYEDQEGTLWIGTDGGGVSRFRDGRFSTYGVAEGLPDNLVRTITRDRDGAVLAGTARGMARIAGGRVTLYHPEAEFAAADITALAWHPDGSLWVAASTGLYRVDAGGRVTAFGPEQGIPRGNTEAVFVDADRTVWVGTFAHGLFRYEAGRFEGYSTGDGLPGAARVAVVTQSDDKGLWLGTDGGLVRLKPPLLTVSTHLDGLPDDFIGSIREDREGSAWVWTARGLVRFRDGAVRAFTASDGVPNDRMGGIALGRDGLPLVYTRSDGLVRWTGARFMPIAKDLDIPWHQVMSLVEDREGTLWIAISKGGLLRVRDGRITHLRQADGLAGDDVLAVYGDRGGNIWIGTMQHGVTRIAKNGMTSWSTRDGLAANHVKAFHEDASGVLWVGTHGGGLSRFKDGQFASISAREGLYNDDVFTILEDGRGNLWMNCNAGIWRTSLAQLNAVADGRQARVESFGYGTTEGMLSSEGVGAPHPGSAMRDGTLWFGSIKGVVVVDPRRQDTTPPRVVIEGATIDGRPASADGPVRLEPGQQNLEIRYTGLSWSRPQAVKFRFRMAPLDRDWVDAGARRIAYYPHLPPGSYTFTVIADNGEGVWNETGQSLAIVVMPPFYQQWWFQALVLATLASVVGSVWRYRIGQVRRAQAAQQAFSRQLIESQERERQRIAAELHDSLGQNLLVVKHLALLGTLAHGDEHTHKQLNQIGATVAQTLEEVRTISYNLRPHHLDQLGLTTTIRAMVDKIRDSSPVRVTSELDDIDGVFAPEEEITIYRIIQESLNNVVKHSGASEAHVAVRCDDHHVDVTIRDNGHGFSARTQDTRASYAGGFGLKGLAHRVDILGGTHTIESSPNEGTRVSVRLDVRARQESRHGA